MKRGKRFLILFGLILALATTASAQFPFYDIELTPVCLVDTSGSRTDATSAQLYVLGRNGFDVVYQFYFDQAGNKLALDTTTTTVYASPCYEVKTDTVGGFVYEGSFAITGDTIPEGLYTAVTINNLGFDTHVIFVGGLGSTYRMQPGESFHFHAYYDPVRQRHIRNPEILIEPGIPAVNKLRIYLQP
jgi:hypothetical protein